MKSILVVEDSPTQAQQIEALLGTEYEVTVARTGEEALALIDADRYDLVVSDIMMPGITGYDLCRQIKASSAHKDLPVILLTSLTNPMDIVRGLEAGADNYITKPYEPTQLRARIRRVADQHTMRRNQRTMMGVNISFLGSTFTITSEKEQILDVLLSAVEDTVRTNRLLEERQRELADAHARLEASARESARAARISEERARVLMQNAGDAIFLLDAQGTILEVNSRAVELLGREPELLLYRPLPEFIIEANGGRLRSTLDRLYREGTASVEGQIVDSDVIVELSGSVTHLDGEAFSLLIARDVTERRQAEERLRRSERQFAEAQQIARVGSWEWRPDEDVIESSEELDRLFGMRFRELGGDATQVVLDRIDPADRARVESAFEDVRAGVPMDLEYTISDATGDRRIMHALGERVSNEGEPPVVRGTVQDVTERRRAEHRVLERESMLRTLFEASPIAIITLDTQGRVLSWNPAAESIFSWPAEEIIGGPLPQIPEGKEEEEYKALLSRILAGDAVVNEEVRRVRRDGALLDISVSAAALRDASGRTTGVVAMMIDVSEQKRAAAALHSSEEQLRHAQRMEAIGRLTGGIAHDFNNMLTAIQGTTQLLLMDYAADKALADELREIDRAASRAAELTRQLLAFSRKQPVQPKILDLNTVIRDMNRMLDRLVGETIVLHTRLRADLPSVLADPGQMEQIVMNLVVNARDAMADGGELFIETGAGETLFEGATSPLPCVTLSVRDTGSGIEPDVLERIFDPFFTTKPAGVGTGLGLSTVYGIVRQNNGRIQVDSRPGAGTTFTIMLPLASEESTEEPDQAVAAEPASGSETVLLVEDDQAIRKLASRVLRRHGYMVLEASSGPEAIDLAEQFIHSIQLVVSDMVMPGMTGRELIDRLTAMRPDLRVLFISGYSDDSVRNLSPANRRAALLEKPFTADAFAAKVRETLDAH